MSSSDARAADSYPMTWFQALRWAVASPGEWVYMATHVAEPGSGGKRNFGNRLRSLLKSLQRYKSFEPELVRAMAEGHFTIRSYPNPDIPTMTEFRVTYRTTGTNLEELLEKALAGG